MFDSVEECVSYLKSVNDGSVKMDDKWVLMRKSIRTLEKIKGVQ